MGDTRPPSVSRWTSPPTPLVTTTRGLAHGPPKKEKGKNDTPVLGVGGGSTVVTRPCPCPCPSTDGDDRTTARTDRRPLSTSTPVTKFCGRSLARPPAACEGRRDATRRDATTNVGRTPTRDGVPCTRRATCGGTSARSLANARAAIAPRARTYVPRRTDDEKNRPNDVKRVRHLSPTRVTNHDPQRWIPRVPRRRRTRRNAIGHVNRRTTRIVETLNANSAPGAPRGPREHVRPSVGNEQRRPRGATRRAVRRAKARRPERTRHDTARPRGRPSGGSSSIAIVCRSRASHTPCAGARGSARSGGSPWNHVPSVPAAIATPPAHGTRHACPLAVRELHTVSTVIDAPASPLANGWSHETRAVNVSSGTRYTDCVPPSRSCERL